MAAANVFGEIQRAMGHTDEAGISAKNVLLWLIGVQ
jgi:hypothetical protein